MRDQTNQRVITARTVTPAPQGVIQRQCTCGQHTGGGACAACRTQRDGTLQRTAITREPLSIIPQRVQDGMRSSGQPRDAASPVSANPRFSHDFSRIPIHPPAPGAIQTKLAINKPGDSYEQEADRIADQVLAAPAHSAVRGAPPRIQRFAGQPAGQPNMVPASVDRVLASPGRPLDPALRQDMEQRFGRDFSRVRVHTDADAAKSAISIKARAFTSGQDIVFRQGEYKPSSRVGQQLLAHELTHVVQQENARQSEQIQRAPEGGSEEPSIAGTLDNAIEMWKDIIADRHFQQKGPEGNITFARMKILNKKGHAVVNIVSESDKSLHAEEKAIRVARKQIGKGQKFEGGKIIFVTDQTVCSHAGRCRDRIKIFAEELGVEDATATTFMRPPLPQEPESGPKATAKKVQKRAVAGLELTISTETIYKRPPTLAPVHPAARVASGVITVPPKVPPDTGSGGGGARVTGQSKGTTTYGHVTVEYDLHSPDPKNAIKLKNIDLSDYPPEKKGPISRSFNDRPVLAQITSMAGNLAIGYASNKALDLIESHFASVLEEAREEFATRFPSRNSLFSSADIEGHRKAYESAMAKLGGPGRLRNAALAMAWLLTPEKQRAAAVRQVEQSLAGLGITADDVMSYLDAAFAYESAMLDLYEQVARYSVELGRLSIAGDIRLRAAVLQRCADDLYKSAQSVAATGLVAFLPFEDLFLTLWSLGDRFNRLGDTMASFAWEITERGSEYEQLLNSLDSQLLRIGTQLDMWRPTYDTNKKRNTSTTRSRK